MGWPNVHISLLYVILSHKDIEEIYIREVVKLQGFPSSIAFDQDRLFHNQFWTKLFKMAGTKLKFSSTYILSLMDN